MYVLCVLGKSLSLKTLKVRKTQFSSTWHWLYCANRGKSVFLIMEADVAQKDTQNRCGKQKILFKH